MLHLAYFCSGEGGWKVSTELHLDFLEDSFARGRDVRTRCTVYMPKGNSHPSFCQDVAIHNASWLC